MRSITQHGGRTPESRLTWIFWAPTTLLSGLVGSERRYVHASAALPVRDLLLCAKHLFVATMVDGSALRADGLIADEADRFDATKAGHWGGVTWQATSHDENS